ncbi:MAG: hypothetical protein IKK98_07570, partial [Oscillospiraceae bacterium]|nr:hypothetical protein [Oscillospiraceae bacterium]
MKQTKRLFSAFLAILLMVGLVPLAGIEAAWASATRPNVQIDYNLPDGVSVTGQAEVDYDDSWSEWLIDDQGLSCEGYLLLGWNTQPDGSGDEIIGWIQYDETPSPLTVYAQWVKSNFTFGLTANEESTVTIKLVDLEGSETELKQKFLHQSSYHNTYLAYTDGTVAPGWYQLIITYSYRNEDYINSYLVEVTEEGADLEWLYASEQNFYGDDSGAGAANKVLVANLKKIAQRHYQESILTVSDKQQDDAEGAQEIIDTATTGDLAQVGLAFDWFDLTLSGKHNFSGAENTLTDLTEPITVAMKLAEDKTFKGLYSYHDGQVVEFSEAASGPAYDQNAGYWSMTQPDAYYIDGDVIFFCVDKLSTFALVYEGQPPVITRQPESQTAAIGEESVLSLEATGEDLRYRWEGSVDDGNTWSFVGGMQTLRTIAHKNSYPVTWFRCIVSNEFGSVTSDEVTLTVPGAQGPGGRPGIQEPDDDVDDGTVVKGPYDADGNPVKEDTASSSGADKDNPATADSSEIAVVLAAACLAIMAVFVILIRKPGRA